MMSKDYLVCIDGSESSMKSLDCAVGLANQTGAGLVLLEVFEPHQPLPGFYKDNKFSGDMAEFAAEQKIETLLPKIEEIKGKWSRKVRKGYPAEEIIKESEENEYEMIIIGTHGANALERFLIGSVSTRVLHHANCSVLVVR